MGEMNLNNFPDEFGWINQLDGLGNDSQLFNRISTF